MIDRMPPRDLDDIYGPGAEAADLEARWDVIKHGDAEYKVDLEGKEKPVAEHQKSHTTSNDVWDVYKLTGAHVGPPIEIEIKNFRMDRDDDGWILEDDGWRWVDDKTPFDDDVLCDVYSDAVRDDMREMFRSQ